MKRLLIVLLVLFAGNLFAQSPYDILGIYPKKDTVVVTRPSGGTSGLKYSLHRIAGIFAPPTAVDASALSSTSLRITWTIPVTTTASTARPMNSLVVCWNDTGYVSTLAAAANKAWTLKDSTGYTISSLTASHKYYVNVFSYSYADEISANAAGSRDTCTTSAGGGSALDTTNLSAYWKMDEATSITRVDSKDSHDITDLSSNVVASTDAFLGSHSASMNGVLAQFFYTAMPAGSNLLPGYNGFTVTGWMKLDSAVGSAEKTVISCMDQSNPNWYVVYVGSSNGLYFRTYDSTASHSQTAVGTSVTISTGTWYFFCARYNYATDSVYFRVNATSGSTGKMNFKINQVASDYCRFLYRSSGDRLPGKLDEVSWWQRRLTDAEVDKIYNSGAGYAYPFGN